jgi:hypothetical protein
VASEIPKYKVGDFVRCSYELHDFYYYLYGDDDDSYPYFRFYGVIVDVVLNDEYWHFSTETVYHVYCLDRLYRFFLEDEVVRV